MRPEVSWVIHIPACRTSGHHGFLTKISKYAYACVCVYIYIAYVVFAHLFIWRMYSIGNMGSVFGKSYIHTYIHTYIHACIHTCIHTYIYT